MTEERRPISQEEVELVKALHARRDRSNEAREILRHKLYRTPDLALRQYIMFLLVIYWQHAPLLKIHIEEWHQTVMEYVEPD